MTVAIGTGEIAEGYQIITAGKSEVFAMFTLVVFLLIVVIVVFERRQAKENERLERRENFEKQMAERNAQSLAGLDHSTQSLAESTKQMSAVIISISRDHKTHGDQILAIKEQNKETHRILQLILKDSL